MKHMSLIQVIVLLHEKASLKKSSHDDKIDRFDATSENLAQAKKLAYEVLEGNLSCSLEEPATPSLENIKYR